jgi:8-oxo-dGTP pyrophosphatase MutT (NUDIX family)
VAPSVLSCGILVVDDDDELLLCHAMGTSRWDIPKGRREPGESEVEAAIRETFEESGLRFEARVLLDLGRFRYRPGKDLHLFATRTDRVDLSRCHCSTRFRDARGRLVPEMDGYAWVAFDEVAQRCAKNMAALLTKTLSLHEVSERLRRTDTAS